MNIESAHRQADEFLSISGEFRLGALVTEQSHPVTRELSAVADADTVEALGLLFEVDEDVVETYRRWMGKGESERIAATVTEALRNGGRVFFTGCGATGRLSILLESMWRRFWADLSPSGDASHNYPTAVGDETAVGTLYSIQIPPHPDPLPQAGEGKSPRPPVSPSPRHNRPLAPWPPPPLAESIMAGGDYALIKSVEGFEDFAQFGGKQIEDMGVSEGDVVFAITEGGETSFVIGTAWKGLEKGAKVYFVYCNPDDVLRETVTRSREVLDEPRIEKINLTTGPMAITGSTRMQATSIQLLVMGTVLEMVANELQVPSSRFQVDLMAGLEFVHEELESEGLREELAGVVELEAETYRRGRKSTYFADYFGVDVLTDTTERSPTFCTPAFRKWDDPGASESWTYLVLPYPDSASAWSGLLKRPPHALTWSDEEIRSLVGEEKSPRQSEIMRQIGPEEILRFRIGLDGLQHRPIAQGDLAVCVISEAEVDSLLSPGGFFRMQLEAAERTGASGAVIFAGRPDSIARVRSFLETSMPECRSVFLPLPEEDSPLDIIARVGIKMLLNALSTCVMVKLGRVKGNCMVAVAPSNLKLIDRSARYVQTLTGLSYEDACRLLFESIEYVRPRMQAGKAYPPVVKLTVTRWECGCGLEEAEGLVLAGS